MSPQTKAKLSITLLISFFFFFFSFRPFLLCLHKRLRLDICVCVCPQPIDLEKEDDAEMRSIDSFPLCALSTSLGVFSPYPNGIHHVGSRTPPPFFLLFLFTCYITGHKRNTLEGLPNVYAKFYESYIIIYLYETISHIISIHGCTYNKANNLIIYLI